MTKAILVIDMPSCCNVCYFNNAIGECKFVGNVDEALKHSLRYVKCPLKEMLKGEWIRNFNGNEYYWYCTNCKEEYYEEDLYMGGNEFPNFCPNCGADMRGRKE